MDDLEHQHGGDCGCRAEDYRAMSAGLDRRWRGRRRRGLIVLLLAAVALAIAVGFIGF